MTSSRAVFSPRRGARRAAQGFLPSPEPPICPALFTFELPIPPSSNGAYANVAGRGRVATREHKEWKRTAGWELMIVKPPKIAGPYRFTILLPEKMRGDVDGRIKLAMDLLVNLGLTPDDRHALSATAERRADIPKGRCVIIVSAV